MAEKKRSYGLLESFAQIGRWDDSKKTTLTTFGRKDRVEKWVVTDGQLYFVEPLSGNFVEPLSGNLFVSIGLECETDQLHEGSQCCTGPGLSSKPCAGIEILQIDG